MLQFCGFRMINEAKDKLASIFSVGSSTTCFSFESPWPVSFMTLSEHCITVHAVTKSSPSPSISCTENAHLDVHISRIKVSDSEPGHSVSSSEAEVSKKLQDVHISAQLMEDFLELARDNTKKDLETCGILGAFLKMGTFYVTTLIVPKQESTSNTCQAINEEEIFAIQHEKSLLPLGWIHTHPSQSCFMSSVDLHTQYSYQNDISSASTRSTYQTPFYVENVCKNPLPNKILGIPPYEAMVPEAFSIVMAPTDTSRCYGIFRLSDPIGMRILKDCQEGGFHHHKEPENGGPIYEQCTNIYLNSNLRFEIFDLR